MNPAVRADKAWIGTVGRQTNCNVFTSLSVTETARESHKMKKMCCEARNGKQVMNNVRSALAG